MKKINHYASLFFCLFCFSCNSEMDSGLLTSEYVESYQSLWDGMNTDRPEDSYNYPVLPGSKKWESFKSGEEMKKACQIPTKILKRMSTQAIVQALWEYPQLSEIIHRYQYQADFESTFLDNNAYLELLTREGAGACLLLRMQLVDPNTSIRTGWAMRAMEIFMAQPEILSKLSDNEKKTLIKTIFEKENGLDDMIGTGKGACWLLYARTLVSAGYTPFLEIVNSDKEMNAFLYEKWYTYIVLDEIKQLIYQHCIQYFDN